MHIDILIDGSGSMGFMKGSGFENQYLIDEKHTRTDLVKNILIESLLVSLDFVDTISIESFLNIKKLNSLGNPVTKNNRYVEYPDLVSHFSGKYDKTELITAIQNIENPEPNGTPLRWSLLYKINKSSSSNHHIIIFSDGEGHWDSKIDEEWPEIILKLIKSKGKNIRIHFVGIAQNENIKKKCKYICSETHGAYTNLASMNYNVSQLNGLLFNLKSNIISNILNTNAVYVSNVYKNTVEKDTVEKDTVEKDTVEKDTVEKDTVEKDTFQTNLEIQVNRNTKSLELITNQLDNIVKLLSYKNESDEVIIDENKELNLKIGRLAEEFLYNELSKNKWDITWLNQDEEKFMPYDFEIRDDKDTYYYECKGTINNVAEFQLTRNEWLFYLKNRGKYRLCFVSNVISNPSYIRFMDLLEEIKEGKLIPCSYKNIKLKADRLVFTLNQD